MKQQVEPDARPMTEQRLKEIEARISTATPGPWEYWEHLNVNYRGEHLHGVTIIEGLYKYNATHCTRPEDSIFIAHSRQDVPELLAEVRRLRAAIEEHHSQTILCDMYVINEEKIKGFYKIGAKLWYGLDEEPPREE